MRKIVFLCVAMLAGRLAAAPFVAPAIEGLGFEIGSLESSDLDSSRPRLFCSPDEVSRARSLIQSDERIRAVFDRLIHRADEHLTIEIEALDERWWDGARDKPWQETYPQVFEKTSVEPRRYAEPAAVLAKAYLLTGDERYADKAIDLIMNLASYSFEPEHYDVGMNYAIWSLSVLKTYDCLGSRMTAGQRLAMDALMTRSAWAVARNDVYWIENGIGGGINNHLAWHKTLLGLLGLFYDRPDMVDFCMNSRRGLVRLLADGLLDDGLWCESSLNYQFAAIAPMLIMADCQHRIGSLPGLRDIIAPNGRTLKQSYDAMFNVLAPGGMIPTIGDTYGVRQNLWKVPLYEICWTLWGDLRYAWLINQNPEPSAYLLFAPPVPKKTPAPTIRSVLLPEHGYAFLRSHRDENYWNTDAWCAFLTYDRSGVHANADKLSLMLFSGNQMLLSDVEGRTTTQSHSFSSRIQGQLNRGALSQNTVMIDGQDQRCRPEMLTLVEFHDLADEKRVTAADDRSLLYDGVRQMRTVAMTPDYVLDVFQVDGGQSERQIDWLAHIMDEDAEAPAPLNPSLADAEPFDLPDTGAWPWLRDARSCRPQGLIRMEWRNGDARLRLRMLNASADRIIVCGYPASDAPDAATIPMVIVRKHGRRAVFAAVWLIGDRTTDVTFEPLPPHDGKLVYEVKADGRARRHVIPALKPARR